MARELQARGRGHQPAVAQNDRRLILLLTGYQWMLAVIVGLLLAAIFLPNYRYISPWVGVALFVVGVIVTHLRYASRFIMPFPHIALLIAALQYVFGAWISIRYPHTTPTYNIGLGLPGYLEYATLTLVSCTVGWGIGLVKMKPVPPVVERVTPELLVGFDVLILIGFIATVLGRGLRETSLGFIFILLANLRYVGVFGRMLCKARGWLWRLGLVLILEVMFATGSGMFHGLLLWLAWTAAMWVILFKPSWPKILLVLVATILLLPALQESKWQLRGGEYGDAGDDVRRETVSDKSFLWLSYLGGGIQKTVTGNLDEEFMGDTVMRYNQGWIVNRVMQWVPAYEPYARGATLKDALIATLLPRFLMPNKVVAGGRANMERYAGIELNEVTSMNLGYAGELYANFGYWGGIIGCGVYAMLLALLFRWVSIRAFASPLWWSVMPYVGFLALKAEEGIVEVINWTFKACIVIVFVCVAFPALRRELFRPAQPTGAAFKPAPIRGRRSAPRSENRAYADG